MKTGKATIGGKEYTLCLSTRVVKNIQDKYGLDVDSALNKLVSEGNVGDMFWFLSQLLIAGDKYLTLNGIDHDAPPSEDDLLDTVGVDDYETLFTSIGLAVQAGEQVDVLTEDNKQKNV